MALETSLVEWKQLIRLSNGETIRILGNFLSGMETTERTMPEGKWRAALETSLVEWKLSGSNDNISSMDTLETSLVEWKPPNSP